ncbi:hypothetical protein [Mycobacterium sp. SMC-19]|uniref:hypothetical protein n=1 Tax=Mycobacterium sp. SMC-19 TaxID=3381630 RepID=UPI003875FAEF
MSPKNVARTYWKCVLALFVTLSVAGNVQYAILIAPEPFTVGAGVATAVAPLALFLVTEGLTLGAGSGVRRATYRVAVTALAAITAAAFAASYIQLHSLLLEFRLPAITAVLAPAIVDAVVAVSSLMILAMRPTATVAAPVAGGQVVAAPPTDPAAEPVAGAVAAARTSAGLHLVAGPGDHNMGGSDHAAAGAAGIPMTSADAHLDRAAELVAAGVVKAPPPTVAAALAGLADGGSHRAVAAATGLHRTSVSRLAAAAEEAVGVG